MPEEIHLSLKLRKYLLGNVTSREERQNIEERLMLDDAYFQELCIEEGELIQEYADDLLSESERVSFEKQFLVSEERRKRVRFARALRLYVDEQKISPETAPEKRANERGSISFFRHFFASPLRAAFAALVLAAFSAVLIWNFGSYSSSNNRESLALLNKAYENGRPFETRISGFDYAPATSLRGAAKTTVDSTTQDLAENIALSSAQKSPTADNLHGLGRVYLVKKELDKSIEQLEKSAQLAPQNAEISSDLGTAYLEKSKTLAKDDGRMLELSSRALESFEKSIKLNPNLLAARFNRAVCLQHLNTPRQAQEAWQEYLNLDSDSPWAEEARRNLRTLDLNQSQSKTKEQLVQDFLSYYEQSDHEKAWQTYSRNREMITGKLIPQQLAGLFLEAADEGQKNNYLAALKYVGKLEKEKSGDAYFSDIAGFYSSVSSEKLGDLRQAQRSFNRGYAFRLETRGKEALAEFTNARTLFEKSGNVWESRLADYWIAFCEFQLNDIDKSTQRLENLTAYCEKKEYKWLVSNSFSRLATNLGATGNYSKALDYNVKSLKLSEETDDLYLNQKILSQLADKYQQLGQYEESVGYLQKSFRWFNYPETSDRQKMRIYSYAVELLTARKLYAAAASLAKESLALNAAGVDDQTFAHNNYSQLSRIYAEQKEFQIALEYADQSIRSSEKLPSEQERHKAKAYALVNLAHLQRLNRDCARGVKNYDSAVELYDSMEFSLDNYHARRGRLLCYVENSDSAAIESELPQVLELFKSKRAQILEENNRNTFFDNEQSIYDLAIGYEFGKGNNEKAFDYSEESRARSLLDLQKNGGKVSLEKNQPQIVFDGRIFSPQKLAQIRAQVPVEVDLVQYAVLHDRVLMWLISRNDFQTFSFDISSEELAQHVTSFLEAVKNKDAEKQESDARQLYKILFQPLENSLNGEREICLIPDKILSHLPFAALVSDKTNNFLVADYTLFLAPSANVFIVSSENARKRTQEGVEKLVSVGNPSFDRQAYPALQSLPSAEREARAVAAFYREPTLLLAQDATKKQLKNLVSQAEIIHFAGHYVASAKSPLLSSFLVAGIGKDGGLTNYELFEQKLQKPKLIVLSACQTGVERYYQGEGMIGAGRLFLASGIPLIVASQWEVDSEATAELMQSFHRYRTEGKLSTVSALRRAQLDMLNSRDTAFRQPFHWAGFFAVGGYAHF